MMDGTRKIARNALGALAVATVLVMLPGCGPPDNADAPSDETAPTVDTTPTEDTGDDEVERHELTDELVIEWRDAEVVSDTSIRVFFGMGNEACYGVRSLVEETATQIKIAIIEGTLPDAPDACTLELRKTSLVVETDQPIGDREIVELTDPLDKPS